MRTHPAVPLSLLALLLATTPVMAESGRDKVVDHGKAMDRAMALRHPDNLDWQPGPPALPKGVKVAMLQGDPFQPGPFVIRLKMPAGYVIPPHWHSKAENVTVISGTLHLGMGDTVDKKAAQKLPAGGFHAIAAQVHHYAFAPGGAVVQLHGEGPFDITYLNPEDNPEPNARQSQSTPPAP